MSVQDNEATAARAPAPPDVSTSALAPPALLAVDRLPGCRQTGWKAVGMMGVWSESTY
jgi:hypothetical protein